jgi:hypothetical protein
MLNKIKKFSLDNKGYIVKDNIIIRPFLAKPGIYVYILTLDTKTNNFYIGSTINVIQRIKQHKYRASLKDFSGSFKYNSIFYHHVRLYG